MPKEMRQERPSFPITVGNIYFCLIKSRNNNSIEYEDVVYSVPTAKTIGLTQNTAEQDIWASGEIYEAMVRTNYATISLSTVSLPQHLVNAIEGAESIDGITINKTSDVEKEFAFGFWAENNDGSYQCFWLPVCKLTPTEKSYATRTADLPDPEVSYSVRGIPYNNIWRIKFSSADAKLYGITPPERQYFAEKFFLSPMYEMSQLQSLISEYRTGTGDASVAFAPLSTTKTKKD